MTFGAIGFLHPLLLAGLLALPVIWWLLRFTPPRPERVTFPPTRILAGIKTHEHTPAKSPWWLTALRMLIAALIILALAGPVYDPDPKAQPGLNRPVLLLIDNGWAAASRWSLRKQMIETIIRQAESRGQPIHLVTTAGPDGNSPVEPLDPGKAREKSAGMQPMPFDPDRGRAAERLNGSLPDTKGFNVIWLSDGIDYGAADAFNAALRRLAGPDGSLTVVKDAPDAGALALFAYPGQSRELTARILRPGGAPRDGSINAFGSRGARLAQASFSLGAGETAAETVIPLPLELRNQVTRLEIAGEPSAGAVYLLDSRSQWRRIGLISGESRESAQPLLSQTHYIEKALAPFSEVIASKDHNADTAVDELMQHKPSALILANIGNLTGQTGLRLKNWINNGGMLIRFAGPRLEKGGDALLPVPLREGERALGGALSWSSPQKLAPFEEMSPYSGLLISEDITVSSQVLADPAQLRAQGQVWSRLLDGTPLVTARRLGMGWVVLFHVTANSDWSNLPLSGLFVEMLRRTVELATVMGEEADAAGAGMNETGEGAPSGKSAKSAEAASLAPWQTLNGFGRLGAPPAPARALQLERLDAISPSAAHPPGLYGSPGRLRALNLIAPRTRLIPLGASSAAAEAAYTVQNPVFLAAWLLLGAFMLFCADALLMLFMSLGLRLDLARRTRAAVILFLLISPWLSFAPQAAAAPAESPVSDSALQAALKTRLAYVLTGDPSIDQVSRAGLTGLSRVLSMRTAAEPAEPAGVDVNRDELVFFPLLYWPVPSDARPLSDATLAKVDAYMKHGGMIIFDTRDYQTPLPRTGPQGPGGGSGALAALLSKLDLPRLEPVPEDHVLTKSFYLLRSFPGRWDGGALWVEAKAESEEKGMRRALKTDGVSSILITSNDFAAAWAADEAGRPLYAAVPGGEEQREMAYRVGVNIVMYALTGNYKEDQVHVPALLERLGH